MKYFSMRMRLDDVIKSKDFEKLVLENVRRCNRLAGQNRFQVVFWNEHLTEQNCKDFVKRNEHLLFEINTKITKEFGYVWFLIDSTNEKSTSRYKSSGDVYNTSQENSTSIKICPNIGHQDFRQYNAQFIMTGMKDEDAFTSITGYCGWYHGSNYLVGSSMSGHYSQDLGGGSPSITGFEFKVSDGTFEGGSISIYGLKES